MIDPVVPAAAVAGAVTVTVSASPLPMVDVIGDGEGSNAPCQPRVASTCHESRGAVDQPVATIVAEPPGDTVTDGGAPTLKYAWSATGWHGSRPAAAAAFDHARVAVKSPSCAIAVTHRSPTSPYSVDHGFAGSPSQNAGASGYGSVIASISSCDAFS